MIMHLIQLIHLKDWLKKNNLRPHNVTQSQHAFLHQINLILLVCVHDFQPQFDDREMAEELTAGGLGDGGAEEPELE